MVHPHVRGEDEIARASHVTITGSPPRAWGGLRGDADLRRSMRFTPTCVGRTGACGHRRCRPEVHPHVRGEDRSVIAPASRPPGSPPRAWGGRTHREKPCDPPRFTPTCVGRTPRRASTPYRCAVHPHVRGEDYTACATSFTGIGSPPRAWGGLNERGERLGVGRFTPTCVGRTWVPDSVTERIPVHPHVRGEDAAARQPWATVLGSPPRAWGGHFVTCGFTRLGDTLHPYRGH